MIVSFFSKNKLFFSVVFLSLFLTVSFVVALGENVDTIGKGNYQLLGQLLENVISIVWYCAVALTVISFMVAGILFLTAHGEPDKLETARKAVLWGVVGVAVMIIGYSIVAILKTQMGIK